LFKRCSTKTINRSSLHVVSDFSKLCIFLPFCLYTNILISASCQVPVLTPGAPLARKYDFIYFVQQVLFKDNNLSLYIYIDLMNSILLDLLEWVAWLTWSLFNQWQISTCYIKSCLKPARAVFSIDGLWPSSYSRKTPSNCCAGSNFVPQKVLHLFLVFHTKYHSKASTKRYTGHGSNVIYKVKLCLFQRD
jgi:hypothetical protein